MTSDYPTNCPNCHNESVWQPTGEEWYLDVSDGMIGVEIKFCPFCGYKLDKKQEGEPLPDDTAKM